MTNTIRAPLQAAFLQNLAVAAALLQALDWVNVPLELARVALQRRLHSGGGRPALEAWLERYADALSARLVAQYVRSEFRGVAVVPVSEREVNRASSAAIRLSASRSVRGASGTRVRWPQSAVTVAFSPTAPTASAASL